MPPLAATIAIKHLIFWSLSFSIIQVFQGFREQTCGWAFSFRISSREQNSSIHQLQQVIHVLTQQSSLRPSHYHHIPHYHHHHTWLLSCQSTDYFSRSFGDRQQWFSPWSSLVDATFAQSLYCWIINTDLNRGKWGLQFFRCFSVLFWTSCMSHRCTLGVILIVRTILGSLNAVPSSLFLWKMTLNIVWWSPNALGTLPRLMWLFFLFVLKLL